MNGTVRPMIPADHPIWAVFHTLAERGLGQRDIRDRASVVYVGNLLAELLRTDDLYRMRDADGRRIVHLAALVAAAERSADAHERKRRYRYLGDFCSCWGCSRKGPPAPRPPRILFGARPPVLPHRGGFGLDRLGTGRVPQALGTLRRVRSRVELGETVHRRPVLQVHVPGIPRHLIRAPERRQQGQPTEAIVTALRLIL